jgi:hypothetical protein
MGQAGQARAQAVYDWRTVIGQYEALWAQLQEQRQAALAATPSLAPSAGHPWPARLEPLHGFAAYPSAVLTPEAMLTVAEGFQGPAVALQLIAAERRLRGLSMVRFAQPVMLSPQETEAVLVQAAQGPKGARSIVSVLPVERQAHGLRALVTLMKLGLLKRA